MPEPITGLPVSLDRGSPVPLYFQVATQLEELIESGEMPVGGRLANEVELADRLGVSRPTMRRAIQYLVERGMLVRKRGVGTQVVHPKVRRPVELTSLYDDLAKSGQSPVTEVLDLASAPRPSGSPSPAASRWAPRSLVRAAALRRGEPLALMHNACRRRSCRRTRGPRERGLYELLRAAGHVPRMATQVVGARAPTRPRRGCSTRAGARPC